MLESLLQQLEREAAATLVTPAILLGVTASPAPKPAGTLVPPVTPCGEDGQASHTEARDELRDAAHQAEIERYARMQEVALRLESDPTMPRAMATHTDVEPGVVLVTLAIRNIGTCELAIPSDKYDPLKLLEIAQSGHTSRGRTP